MLGIRVRRHLQGIAQLLQTYARLAELELTAGEKPRPGDVSLPEGTKQQVRVWAEGEEAKVREREELIEDLSQAKQSHGYDPTPIREVMAARGLRVDCKVPGGGRKPQRVSSPTDYWRYPDHARRKSPG